MVYSEYFSEDHSSENKDFSKTSLTPYNEVLEDMEILFEEISGVEFDIQNIGFAYEKLIVNHLKSYGRLIDRDLEGYLDRVMHFIVSVIDSVNQTPLTNKQGIEIKEKFRKFTYETFKEYIWINNPIITSYNPFGKNELIKYTDLNI